MDKDVLVLANAIVEDCIGFDFDEGEYPQYSCYHCKATLSGLDLSKEEIERDFKHGINCPVLLAQKVLSESNRIPNPDTPPTLLGIPIVYMGSMPLTVDHIKIKFGNFNDIRK